MRAAVLRPHRRLVSTPKLSDHRPFRRHPNSRAGEDRENGALRALGVFLLIGIFHTNVRQQTGQQRGVNFAILCRFAIHPAGRVL